MKIKLFRSATVGLNLEGFKILLDPWLTDGEYLGSWSHYPFYDLDKNLDEINSYNAIYISHIHPDHCSEETLKKISKSIPIYIHSYHAKFLKFKLEKLGFKVVELINNKRTKIGKNAFINIFAADNCNPSLCYKFTGCADLSAKEKHSQQIDSLSLIDDGKNVVMNVNDCPFDLAKTTFYEIKNQYKKIDILLTGYGGAGPYPQCFENLNLKEKKVAALEKEKKFLIQATKFIDEMRPEYYLPFAGTYTLTGKLSNLQSLRGVPNIDKAYNFFENYYLSKSESYRIKPLKLNPGSTFDFNTHHYDKEYKLFDHNDYDKYINKNLCKKKMSYEKDETPNFEEIYEIAKKAHHRFTEKIKSLNIKLKSDIFIKVDDKSLKLGLDKNLSIVPTKKIESSSSRYVIYETDIRLLKRLLMGPKFAHWNNAEIGSHLKFFRKPDIFERNVYSAMCYFHS